MQQSSESSVFHTRSIAWSDRYAWTSSSTRSAVRRSASSRSAIRLPLRKKLLAARSICSGRYTLPAASRARRSSADTSTITTSSAWSKTVSGTVSQTLMPVMPPTTSFRLSMCCTLSVVNTSMPAARSSWMSCQRFGCREPGTFVCASSSTRISAGCRANAASRPNSSSVRSWYAIFARGRIGSSESSASVSLRPCVSSSPTTTSLPSCRSWRAAVSIAYVLPTPADAPK